ncbi:hypothetical protein AB4Z45_27795 [Paenibacillus sp. MCAF9]|uniref:hypothetical protein n=1 Tax=Paenibacillus sp. MCAF9 TaxID=3233046 RepID=UPI003F99C2AC
MTIEDLEQIFIAAGIEEEFKKHRLKLLFELDNNLIFQEPGAEVACRKIIMKIFGLVKHFDLERLYGFMKYELDPTKNPANNKPGNFLERWLEMQALTGDKGALCDLAFYRMANGLL